MSFNLKEAADRLIRIADAIDREASDCTYFVCDECNHTANLTTINSRRKEAALRIAREDVADITINDIIGCAVPGCAGSMKYATTENSAKYYVDAAEEEVEAAEGEKGEVDFKLTEEAPDALPEEVEEEPKEEEAPKKEKEPKEEAPKEEKEPEEDMPEKDKAEEIFEPINDFQTEEVEVMEEEPKKEKKETKKDKPDDEEAAFPKEKTPKFEKTKEAADHGFWDSVSRYTI